MGGKLNILEYCVNDLMLVVDSANDQDQQTPLMGAAGAGHLDTVAYLLTCDAKHGESGSTPLHNAVQNGYVEMAMMLLEKKIAVDKVNKRGQTALAVSAENQQYECCKLLINNGANLYVQDENGQLASDTAEGTLNARVVELFRQAMIDNPRKEDE